MNDAVESSPFPHFRRLWQAAGLGVTGLVLLPLIVLLSSWSQVDPALWRHLTAHVLPELLGNTLALLAGVGVGVLFLGVGLAWLNVIHDYPGRRFLDWALMLPMAVPTYVLAFVFVGFLDFSGPVQSALRALFGPRGYWFPNVRSTGGVILVMTLALYPYVYMLAREAFAGQGRKMMEAARMLGRSGWGAFFHAALPMARPALAAGTALALMESLADFGAVSVFNFNTFTTAIYKAWFGFFDLKAAAQLATLLLFCVTAVLLLERGMRRRARYFRGEGEALARDRIPLTGSRGMLASLAAFSVFSFAFLLPFGQLLLWAVRHAAVDLDLRYARLVGHTLLLGGMASLVTVAGAVLLGGMKRMEPGMVSRAAVRLATLGYALPGSVLAVGVMIFLVWLDRGLSGLYGGQGGGLLFSSGLLALVFAYLVRFLAVAASPVENGLERIRPAIEEVAMSLGAGWGRILQRIHLPILRPGILTALLLVLVEVMKEMPATLLLRPFGWDTLAVRIFELTSEGELKRAALPAVALVLAGLLPVALLVRKSRV